MHDEPDTPSPDEPTSADQSLDDIDTTEHDTFVVTRSVVDTDEMPIVPLAGTDDDDPLGDRDDLDDGVPTPGGAEAGWLAQHLAGVLTALIVLLVGSLALSMWMFTRVSATEDELATTRADLARVESGAALYASQVNGFVETVNGLGPSIDEGLDQAVTGLEDFGSSKIEFTVPIDETIAISETFELKRTVQVPIKTSIPIEEEVDTTVTINGPFGVDIPIDITVPVDIDVPIDLTVDIPIDESVPIDVDVPVKLDVPIALDVEGTELEALTSSLIEGLRAFQEGLDGLTGN